MQLYREVHDPLLNSASMHPVLHRSLMRAADRFNATKFSRWINGPSGRAFRIVAGVAWLAFAVVFRSQWWGVAAAVWSFFPLTAGFFDICWISVGLGGPLRGRTIRAGQVVRIV